MWNMTRDTFSKQMRNNSRICHPYGADNLFGFGFYKDATPTAFGIGAPVPFRYDARVGEEMIF